MDGNHTAELIVAQWGALRAGHELKFLTSTSVSSPKQLRTEIENWNPSIMLVSPNHQTLIEERQEKKAKKEILEEAVPELFRDLGEEEIGQPLNSAEFKNLKYVLQTGFYNRPGYLKFRDALVYRSNKYSTNKKLANTPAPENEMTDQERNAWCSEIFMNLTSAVSKLGGVEKVVTYNILDLDNLKGSAALEACLRMGEQEGLFTNVIPSARLRELLLEQTYPWDLSAIYGSVFVGTAQDLGLVKEALGSVQGVEFVEI